jgi:hypothetical protein
MCRKEAGMAAEVPEQRRAVPRVFGRHPGDLAKNVNGTLGHVAKVAERCRNYI